MCLLHLLSPIAASPIAPPSILPRGRARKSFWQEWPLTRSEYASDPRQPRDRVSVHETGCKNHVALQSSNNELSQSEFGLESVEGWTNEDQREKEDICRDETICHDRDFEAERE